MGWADEVVTVKLEIETVGSIPGRDRQWDWWQARTAFVPPSLGGQDADSVWITTMSETGRQGVHNFHDIYQSVSRDGGKSWTAPEVISSLKRKRQKDGYEVCAGDLWPTYHAASGKVIATGKTFNFEGGTKENRRREKVSYAVMNPKDGAWGPLRFLDMPAKDHGGNVIMAANAGNTQRVDLPGGDILLPVRYMADAGKFNYTSIVVRCRFDGERLSYVEHGSELNIPQGRGLYEPSLVRHAGWYYLTLRADHSGYVARSRDGLNFDKVREWTFDDGSPLGSYNTQQHWVRSGTGLFLVYTRRGAGNDHVFRHRAPLFIGQIDPGRLCVIRATERVLLPEDGATLGNSGVCHISDTESWITCGEGLLRLGKRKNEVNKVHVVRVRAAGSTGAGD
ncbi:MAG: glycoside hydrolase [Verrucomicrobiales bacterium]|nr:glycoside hydrolase [Verrucomicrobiales bacterium]